MLQVAKDLPEQARKLLTSRTTGRMLRCRQATSTTSSGWPGPRRTLRALAKAGTNGLTHEHLANEVFTALALPFAHYATEPELRFGAAELGGRCAACSSIRLPRPQARLAAPHRQPRRGGLAQHRLPVVRRGVLRRAYDPGVGCDPLLEPAGPGGSAETRAHAARPSGHARGEVDVLTATGGLRHQSITSRQAIGHSTRTRSSPG